MTKTAVTLLLLGAVLVVAGVALYTPRGAVVLAGLFCLAAGVGSLEAKSAPEKATERR